MSDSITFKGCTSSQILIEDGTRTARKNLLFYCPGNIQVSEVLNDENVPQEGDVFDEDPELFCQQVRIRTDRIGTGRVEVECLYNKKSERIPELSNGKNPDRQPAFNVSVRSAETVVPFEYAYGNSDTYRAPTVPVTTSSGVPLNASTVRISLILSFSYYSSKFLPEHILNYCGTTNRNAVTICGITIPAECALLRKLSSSIVQTRGQSVSKIDAELEIRPEGFQRVFADRSVSLLGTDGRPSRIYSSVSSITGNVIYGTWLDMLQNGNLTSPIVTVEEPVALNGSGSLAAQNTAPAKLTFREKYPAVWTSLKFPAKAKW